MILSHIVAVAKGGVIGYNNNMPWSVDGELSRFARITQGQVVVMGRMTYLSLPGPLLNREVVVLSKTEQALPDVVVLPSFTEVLKQYEDRHEIFIAGGGRLYDYTIDLVDKIYYTDLQIEVNGDTFYPIDKLNDFIRVYSQMLTTNCRYDYQTYIRK